MMMISNTSPAYHSQTHTFTSPLLHLLASRTSHRQPWMRTQPGQAQNPAEARTRRHHRCFPTQTNHHQLCANPPCVENLDKVGHLFSFGVTKRVQRNQISSLSTGLRNYLYSADERVKLFSFSYN
ncbi:hypothetical protein M758_12G156100 [Ceratodon purpureus]|nr:hypothetical protein M758_12G156100 [Ceratodon purpureus]